MAWGINPYEQKSKVMDCGDVLHAYFKSTPVITLNVGLGARKPLR
jgi:hypothetical protein